MSALPLPDKSVRLSRAGFEKLYEILRTNPDTAKRCAAEFEEDPKGVLERVFKLTKKQREAFENASDDDLRQRAQVLLTELRSATPGSVQFHPRRPAKVANVAGRAEVFGGSCFLVK